MHVSSVLVHSIEVNTPELNLIREALRSLEKELNTGDNLRRDMFLIPVQDLIAGFQIHQMELREEQDKA